VLTNRLGVRHWPVQILASIRDARRAIAPPTLDLARSPGRYHPSYQYVYAPPEPPAGRTATRRPRHWILQLQRISHPIWLISAADRSRVVNWTQSASYGSHASIASCGMRHMQFMIGWPCVGHVSRSSQPLRPRLRVKLRSFDLHGVY
jgi:hypothetical protein